MPTIHCVGSLSKVYRVPVHRIEYIIRTRGIQPAGMAGNVRLFDEPAARRVGSELERIEQEKRGLR